MVGLVLDGGGGSTGNNFGRIICNIRAQESQPGPARQIGPVTLAFWRNPCTLAPYSDTDSLRKVVLKVLWRGGVGG